MNFLAFREQIYDWTLANDENLFNQVNQLTQYIFQTQKNINESIVITRASLNQSSTILNNNFNHYLRLSENKFTQNKIAQSKKIIDEDNKKDQTVTQPRPKMQIFKQALNISLKNLEIKQEQKQADNVSLSQLSLSQAIFKNARLPPYFGSKEFRAQKFLSLFFDEDLGSETLSKKEIESLSNQPLSTPSQNAAGVSPISNNATANGYLPPPPSLETLNLGNNGFYGGMNPSLPPPPTLTLPPPPSLTLPPPPTLTIPPPPPLTLPQLPQPPNLPPPPGLPSMIPNRQSVVQIDERDENKDLLLSIMESTKNKEQPIQNSRDSFISQTREPEPVIQQPKPVQNRPMTLQQELALKLKYGKDYKPPTKVIESRPPLPTSQIRRQQQTSQQSSNNFRQSTKIQDIIGVVGIGQPPKPVQKQVNKPIFEDDQQQQSALFSSGKRKTTTISSMNQSNQYQKTVTKNETDIMMSRSTFNEDMLFKKKPIFSKESIIPTKTQQKTTQKQQKKPIKANALFNQDSDEQDDFTFKKKVTKKAEQAKSKQVVEQKKSNPLIGTSKLQKNQQSIDEPIKKIQKQTKKKTVNKLFGGDSEQQEDIFAKKKTTNKKGVEAAQKKVQSPTKIIQKVEPKKDPVQVQPQVKKSNPLVAEKKKNSLFNDDQQEDFSFKSKKTTKKESKDETKPSKKSSLFNDDEDEDFSFKSKTKTSNKQKSQNSHQVVQQVKKIEPEVKQVEKSPTKKEKNPLFGGIQQVQEDSSFRKKAQKIEKQQKIQQVQQNNNQQETQQQVKLRKIARMGGQPMMGIAQMLTQNPPKKKQPIEQISQVIEQKKSEQIVETKEIIQTSDVQKNIKQTEFVNSQRELDPLEKIITETVLIEQKSEKQVKITEQIIIPKPVDVKPIIVSVQNSESIGQATLQVRRKKNKPKRNLDDIFDQEDKKPEKPKVKVQKESSQVSKVKEQVIEPKEKKINPLFAPIVSQSNEEKQTQISKIAKMSMAGMPQMGLGPLIPKGLIITKPSQAKKIEQQALQRLKHEQQQRAIKQKQEQQQKQKLRQQPKEQQEQNRIAKQKQQQQARKIEEQEQRRKKQQEILRRKQFQEQRQIERKRYEEQKQRQRLIQVQRQNQRLIEQLNQKQRLRVIEEQQNQRKIAQEERIKNEERLRLQAEKQKKASIPALPNFDLTSKNQTSQVTQKNKNSNPLDVPKMPPKTNPLGGLGKSPLSGPLGNPLGGMSQKSTGLLAQSSLPSVPSIKPPVTQKNTGKKSLFDDDQDDTFQRKKPTNVSKPSMPTINQKKKGSLFDDDDGDSSFGLKSKPKTTGAGKKKGLFDDDDDQGFGFGKKPQKKTVEPVSVSIQQPIKKLPEPPKFEQQVKPSVTLSQNPIQKSSNAKKLFGDSDSQEQKGFGKKKIQPAKQTPSLQATTNNFGQNQTKLNLNNQKQIKNKKGLFAGSSDEDDKPIKPAKNAPAKETKSKKGLFGGSSDSDDDAFKKKNTKKTQTSRQTPQPQSSPLISTPKIESSSTSPLIPTKKVESSSPNQLSTQSSKLGNPLLGSSMGPISSPMPAKTQPLTDNKVSQSKPNPPQQQKKRNIFQESQEQSSPIIPKQRMAQKQSKKGLISEDSQDEKPIKVIPVKQQEAQPPVTKTNNNRKLFDESEQDSDEQEMMRKKRMANSKLKKLF